MSSECPSTSIKWCNIWDIGCMSVGQVYFVRFFSRCSFTVTFKEETCYCVGYRPLERDSCWEAVVALNLLLSVYICTLNLALLNDMLSYVRFLCSAATWSASRWWKSRFCVRGAGRSSKASTSCTPELRPSFTETWNATTSLSRGPRARWR